LGGVSKTPLCSYPDPLVHPLFIGLSPSSEQGAKDSSPSIGHFRVSIYRFPIPPSLSFWFPSPPLPPMLAFCASPSCLCLTGQAKSLIQKNTFPPSSRSVDLIFLTFPRVRLILCAVAFFPPLPCGIVYPSLPITLALYNTCRPFPAYLKNH